MEEERKHGSNAVTIEEKQGARRGKFPSCQ